MSLTIVQSKAVVTIFDSSLDHPTVYRTNNYTKETNRYMKIPPQLLYLTRCPKIKNLNNCTFFNFIQLITITINLSIQMEHDVTRKM